jgi:hypothetical protein
MLELFRSAGCPAEHTFVSTLRGRERRTLYCSIPGRGEKTIVITASGERGSTAQHPAESWADFAMLPLLYRALAGEAHEHSYVFAAYNAALSSDAVAERGLERMRRISPNKIAAVINLTGLGLGSIAVWGAAADPNLRLDLLSVSKAAGQELRYVNLGRVPHLSAASANWLPLNLLKRGDPGRPPLIVIHSYSPEIPARGHADPDAAIRIDRGALAQNFRVVALYLAYLDQTLAIRRDRSNAGEPAEGP